MLERGTRTRHQLREREANSFAIELLAPGYLMERYLREDIDLNVLSRASSDLKISREAAVCRYVELHDEPLAAVITKGGVVRYVVRNPISRGSSSGAAIGYHPSLRLIGPWPAVRPEFRPYRKLRRSLAGGSGG
jgi:hypothetical protein